MGGESLISVIILFGFIPVVALLTWLCTLPLMIIYGVLVGRQSRWKIGGPATVVPALVLGALPAILAIGFPVGVLVWGEGGHVTKAGWSLFGLLFLVTFAVTFPVSWIVLHSVVMVRRKVATQVSEANTSSG